MTPQRRPYFGASNGEGTGAAPSTAMPMTGTGTSNTEQFQPDTASGDPLAEDPNTMRRRLMPLAGNATRPTDALSVMRQALAPPKPPTMGGY